MRFLTCLAAPVFGVLALTACIAQAEDPTGIEWELLAIDGQVVDIPATLTVHAGGGISGKAPCNSYAASNLSSLPELSLSGLRSTRMACDRLADEQHFLDVLSSMTGIAQPDARTLVLTGPGGRTMEFVDDLGSTLTRCTTCGPKG